ncbi:MAG: hypothetical protein U5L04_04135 [Trueperaceae bacterium]|nr:hypothetical protein [Trueperaceae bacterium]
MLVRLQLARTELAQSYEVGVIQNTPVPDSTPEQIEELSSLASHAHDLKRSLDTGNEVSHAFRLPWLLQFSGDSLTERGNAVASFQADTEQQLADIQDQIDDIAFDLYELSDEDRQLVREEMGVSASPSLTDEDDDVEADAEDDVETADADDEEEEIEAEDLDTYVHRLLSWCVGVVFGRWDVRFALNPELLPALQGAFERLPVVAPAGLVGPQGYPAEPGQMVPETWLRARPNVIALPEGDEGETLDGAAAYPLAVQWDGVLVSDPNHPRDIAARVREVLKVVFGERAADTEDEAVAVLRGTGRKPDSLEQYFAETRQFFDVHLKQYSKSRRKAPIYWPLQTKSGYTVWLYYPRINQDTLPRVLTEVLEPRISFQKVDVQRLEGQRAKLSSGPEFNKLGKELDEAKQLLGELRNMDAEIRMLINRGYSVDHNDGVVLSAAPLHKLIAWKEAAKEFKKLVKGEYPWCSQHTTWSEEQ